MKKIAINGIIGWDATPNALRRALNEANGEHVEIELASPGGYIAPGLEMFNLIRYYPGNIDIRIVGYAMSMGSYLPLAVKDRKNPGKITAEDNAVYMIHNARGWCGGDHNDVLGYGAYLKGLSGVIAKQYVKRTGKSLEEINGLMDKETFFFGEDMVAAGFVDSIIETGTEIDQASAVATAQAVFSDAMAKISAKQEEARADWRQAAAILDNFQPLAVSEDHPPAAAGKPEKEEVQQMALLKLLADNPAAKAEYDAELAKARAEGEKAGKDAAQAKIAHVAPFLTSTEYGDKVREVAVAALKGEKSTDTLDAVVAAVDAVKEERATAAAAAEGAAAGETPAQTPPAPRAEGQAAKTEDDLKAEIARFKGEV